MVTSDTSFLSLRDSQVSSLSMYAFTSLHSRLECYSIKQLLVIFERNVTIMWGYGVEKLFAVKRCRAFALICKNGWYYLCETVRRSSAHLTSYYSSPPSHIKALQLARIRHICCKITYVCRRKNIPCDLKFL